MLNGPCGAYELKIVPLSFYCSRVDFPSFVLNISPSHRRLPGHGEMELFGVGEILRPRNVQRKVRVEATYTLIVTTYPSLVKYLLFSSFTRLPSPPASHPTDRNMWTRRCGSKEKAVRNKTLPSIHVSNEATRCRTPCTFQSTSLSL